MGEKPYGVEARAGLQLRPVELKKSVAYWLQTPPVCCLIRKGCFLTKSKISKELRVVVRAELCYNRKYVLEREYYVMAEKMQSGPILIHRADILDGLRALFLAQRRFDRLLKEDSYSCGYREGFEDALQSVAQMMGVSDEFEVSQKRLSNGKTEGVTVYPQDSGIAGK